MYHERTSGQRHRRRFALWVAAALAAILVLGALRLDGRVRADMKQQAAASLRAAVQAALVQCYAIEGNYPPSLDYLETTYGLQINHDEFYVTYTAFASNQPPDVQVLPK